MTKRLLMFLLPLFVLLLATTGYAAQITNLSSSFTRGAGTPAVEQKRFAGVAGPATIEVVNGGLGDTALEKVSSSVIRINGIVVFDASNFSQNAIALTKQVALTEGLNSIEVLLQGKPGGTVAIRIKQDIAAEAAAVVGPSGGEVEVAEASSPLHGVKCIIPPDALIENKVISIKVAKEIEDLQGPQNYLGHVVDLGPSGTIFNVPVKLILPYNSIELNQKGVFSESLLKVYNLDTENNIWNIVKESSIDLTNKWVAFSTQHFSYYEINGDRLYDVNSIIKKRDYCPDYDSSKDQIIFVHGLQPTRDGFVDYNFENRRQNTFGNAQDFMASNDQRQVWYFSYDSKSHIEGNGDSLSKAIKFIQERLGNKDKKVKIIAHSEGGLVTRSYLQSTDYGHEIDKVILLGTPNHGALRAYLGGVLGDAVDDMQPSSGFLKDLNNKPMPDDVTIENAYSTDVWGGDGVVFADSAKLYNIEKYPKIKNLECRNDLHHTKDVNDYDKNGIAAIVSTKDFPECENADTCKHPSWVLIKDSFLSSNDVRLSVLPTFITEAGGVVTYTATLTKPAHGEVTVHLDNGQTITIPDGQTTRGIDHTISSMDDPYIGHSSISAAITSASGGVEVNNTPATVVIFDTIDNTILRLSVSPSSAPTGTMVTYVATVTNPAQGDVTVRLSNGRVITIADGHTTGSVDSMFYSDSASLGVAVSGATGGNFESLQVDPTPVFVTPLTGYAPISQGITFSPNPVVLGQNFKITFSLKEIGGIKATFDNIAVRITDPNGSWFDFVKYPAVTIPAGGTLSFQPTNYIPISYPIGTYTAEIWGYALGEWFSFDTLGSAVNPKTFTVQQ